MIIFDTETTGLITNIAAPLRLQPHIIELFALKVNENGDELDCWDCIFRPPIKLADIEQGDKIKSITRLTDEMLVGAPKIAEVMDELSEFFVGERVVVGHNVAYDVSMLVLELRRLDREHRFPFPMKQICTVEATHHLKGRRLKLAELHELLFGETFEDAHSAEADVRATARCLFKLMEMEIIR
jgi:DNA polymerase III epsilon subunit-like protein